MKGAYKTYKTYGTYGTYGTHRTYGAHRAHRTHWAYCHFSLFILSLFIFFASPAAAQIKIGGNVYGGGNQGNVGGTTTVNVRSGDLNKVFGGARMANVGGNAYVNVDGAHASGYVVINYLFGGNDIAGTIGTAAAVSETMPAELTGNKDGVDDTWNTYVHISAKTDPEKPTTYFTAGEIEAAQVWEPAYQMTTNDVKSSAVATGNNQKIYIGQLFAGGNGDYYYDSTTEAGRTTHNIYLNEGDVTPIATKVTDEGEVGFVEPNLTKTYLDVQGGSIVYAYGGGNNATVTEKAVIHVDNPTEVVSHMLVDAETSLEADASVYTAYEASVAAGTPEVPTGYTNLLSSDRFRYDMGINTGFSFPSSDEFQIGRFFGGNNKAEMAIRPTWNLQSGKIRNLYSGGNRGAMTSPEGLLLEIRRNSTLVVDNLYGGCRMADVEPKVDGVYSPVTNLPGYYFPDELSARVLVRGGDINNVYGGNDITGIVYGGNAIGIYKSIRGDVYGGGNGAYPYTDNITFQNDDIYGDLYYESDGTTNALNAFRPNAEQVSIRLRGADAAHPTIIGGSVYCGGNCATLKSVKDNPMVELKIGSYVIADKAFLGNNGEKMVDEGILRRYATDAYNSLTLTDPSIFAGYMDGAAMSLRPSVVFDSRAAGDPDDYDDYTSWIGSFYCGGNVGSMTAPGKSTLRFNRGLVIFEKLVGGCNNANVEEGTYNAAYKGGILGSDDEQLSYMDGGNIKDRLELNMDNVVVQPKRWNDTFTKITSGTLTAGETYYKTDLRTSEFIANGKEEPTVADPYYELTTVGTELVWNTTKWDTGEDDFITTGIGGTADGTGTTYDDVRRLYGGNVYGGCYNSGHVNGNVVININQDLIQRDVVFAEPKDDDPYTIKNEANRRSGVLLESQGDDVMAVAMTVFGAGCGEDTEIWGSTTVNMNNGYVFQVFGGGEEGVVGKANGEGEYVYNAAYSTTVNLKGPNAGYSPEEDGGPLAETEYIYGAGNEGDVLGDSYVYLGNGRIYDAFGGASNADVYGATEVYIGYNGGFPWIRDNVYGGNDFGGTVKGWRNHTTAAYPRAAFDPEMLKSSTYVKYIQGRVDSIFGGSYGNYDYTDPIYKDYTYYRGEVGIPLDKAVGQPRSDDFNFPHLGTNSFVHFIPVDNSNNFVGYIFGGSEGYPGDEDLNDSMQEEAYILVDDTKTKDADRFANVDIYGGGAFAGLGTETSYGAGRSAVDLFAGSFHNVYGGSNQEGLIGYTRVNVPATSTVKVNALFGGGKGYDQASIDATPALAARYCDNYVTCIDYKGANAIVEDAIYGGNENCRIACDTYINIEAPVMQSSGYQATVYGAGYGRKTVSGRTNVFMNNGSNAYKVFGGGRDGNAFNFASLRHWLGLQFTAAGTLPGDLEDKVVAYGNILRTFGTYIASHPINLPTNIGTYPNLEGTYDGTYTNDILTNPDYHQTNVHIMDGGNVSGYAYGGGLGENAVVAGTTYIELKGGNVDRDIYGGGQGGPVYDEYGLRSFTATTNAYIEGGMVRNVYGGGYLGHVGKHTGDISTSYASDIPAVANVTIGKLDGTSFYNGIPAILRNAYGGGEGGSVYGTSNLTINNGYIGYRYKNLAAEGSGASNWQYVEELDDQKPNAIERAGNAFGGGYVVNSYVDVANVNMYGGTLRGSLYGGGEVGPIGRGTVRYKDTYGTGLLNGGARIFKAGKTHVKLYDGHVKRNVFGGGRGHDSWGGDGTLYMDEALKPTLDLQCKGYVFGQTEVDIYGGEVGTDEGVAAGYGNVFGGGDLGFVYSAYEKDGALCIGKKEGTRYTTTDEGYYYKYENGDFVIVGSEKVLTEDCKVLVEPWCKATSALTINGTSYAAGDFVPTSALNYLGNKKDAAWASLAKDDVNKEGVIVHNAVFAGGNTSPGSTEVYANTTTVFGNATASINDAYHRDLISIGRGRVGGLYGDGNLTLVDGYRELNITNYGTDFYHITPEITLDTYNALPVREAAYYEIRYKCLKQCKDNTGKTYTIGSTITADEMQTVFDGVTVGEPAVSMIQPSGKPLAEYWVENGVCSRYAGRPMNTVQRADFCGVFGSRMVMQGAQDRVPETVDYTNYTINRVREVSLNKKASLRTEDALDDRNKEHGNYFGIYSVVNFLGALTSDVDFHNAIRVTDNSDADTYKCEANGHTYGTEEATYYNWKDAFHNDRKRNNATSHNKVALASGVYLELTTEQSTGTGLYEKVWGPITGVVELDLINVQPGMGGGYVYAKNEHGTRSNTGKTQVILTSLNTGAVTYKHFAYTNTVSPNTQEEWETSGNFVHSTQTIIDDCYNIGGKYKVGDAVPAHYWFVKGSVYIYDQYISAYTGSPNAYSEVVSIPLTITSASHGKMTLLNVEPSRYAYYSYKSEGAESVLGESDKVELRETEYGRNDAINYWDYSQLTRTEKELFVAETYVVTADCELDGVPYAAGTVLLPGKTDGSEAGTYYNLKKNAPTKILEEGDTEETPYVHHTAKDKDVDFDYVFRPSNNVSHNTGYILTYNIDNPSQWNTWYSKADGTLPKNQTGGAGYEDGPTYTPTNTGLYGQNDYTIGSIINKGIYDTYQDVVTNHSSVIPAGQASFYPAYIVTDELLETTNKNSTAQRFHKGATLSAEDYAPATWSSLVAAGSVAPAYVVTSTVQLSKTEFIYRDTYMTAAEKDAYIAATDNASLKAEISASVVPAYYCTKAGKYGGNYYQEGHNYRGLAAFSSMSETDRANFTFNYDALDLLIDPTYGDGRANGVQYQYDSAAGDLAGANANPAHYSLQTAIDYSATYKGDTPITYEADNGSPVSTDTRAELTRTEYERLPNEQYYYAPITVTNTGDTYYVVKETIVLGDTPYAAGQVIPKDTYDGLSDDDQAHVQTLNFTSTGTYYYCREGYTINVSNYEAPKTGAVTSVNGEHVGTTYTSATVGGVPAGIVINSVDYNNLVNKQTNFAIHGLAPTETSTLYVARNSDIFDLSAEKIITVIYKYDYVESDMSGSHITPVSEYHVLNIHLNFKSGVPTVEDIKAPDIILPGTTISIPEPYVTPGAYEITGGGWKLFDKESDAESHINGMEYTPATDALYLYQNKHFLAYYAKTYLGETYSNYVPVSVANYHDLKKVIEDLEHHYYIDHKDVIDVAKVEPKIYINDYSGSSQNGLDLLKDLYDLTLVRTDSEGYTVTGDEITAVSTGNTGLLNHHIMNERVAAGNNLEFFLRTDLSRADDPAVPNEWTPIGATAGTCFEGTLHGDGHTISGLDNSLFHHLCGDVYNLGVTGSFKGAGVADADGGSAEKGGYVESCWVKTTAADVDDVKAVFGTPTGGYVSTVNCYYSSDNDYAAGDAAQMPDDAFYNGEVAYDLNNFYLYKRYCDKMVASGVNKYRYYLIGEEDKLELQEEKFYASNPTECSSGYGTLQYVESRFADGDFRYAAGTIPTEADERTYTDPEDATKEYFYPIWPDDYLFFGQKLTYGYSATQPHQDVPTAIARFNGRLSKNADANRVYRAPAYYRNGTMDVAHFNPQAYLAAKSKDGSRDAHPNMTAIDFAGHYEPHPAYGTYGLGNGTGKFYTPLLDDDGLLSIVNVDETQNLLVYAPSSAANSATYDVLTSYFVDPDYADYYDNSDGYQLVGDATPACSSIYGHLIQSDLTASSDHLLVDKQDFNAPIAYDFRSGLRMWYQRVPEDQEYVDFTKGWQGVSIPFTAELVTTHQKGEITHFYEGSDESANGTGKKVGHEYWLREFTRIQDEDTEARAIFSYPSNGVENKTYTNTFLWDYYYSAEAQKDENADTYLQYKQYYNGTRTYENYPYLTAAKPYILGLPGYTYYEFDLSGKFVPENTAAPIDKLEKQTITFASAAGAHICVSDTETANETVSLALEGASKDFTFTFKPSYLRENLTTTDYALNSIGEAFDHVTAAGGIGVPGGATVLPFRPYFTASAAAKAAPTKRELPTRILFAGTNGDEFEQGPESALDGTIEIFARGRHIVTRSHKKEPAVIRIVNIGGVNVTTFVLQPGQTIETPVQAHGAYIVNKKKIFIK